MVPILKQKLNLDIHHYTLLCNKVCERILMKIEQKCEEKKNVDRLDHERIVRQLVNHGADLNTQNNDGWTPLITAVTKSKQQTN